MATLKDLFGDEADQPAAENTKRPLRAVAGFGGQGGGGVQAQGGDHLPAPQVRKKPQATVAGLMQGRNFLTIPLPGPRLVEEAPEPPPEPADLMQQLRAALKLAPLPQSPPDPEPQTEPDTAPRYDPPEPEVPSEPLPPVAPPEVEESSTTIEPMAVTPEMVMSSATDHNPFVYISGPAGTGKTTLARQLVAYGETLGAGRMVMTATTGIAAVNLGQAMTINALLHYFQVKDLQEKFTDKTLHARLRSLTRSGLEWILLDEVSMLSATALDCLVDAIEEINGSSEYDAKLYRDQYGMDPPTEGKLRLILVGDFAQLPPIDEPYAFEGKRWERFATNTFTLTKVWRQDDLRFVQALQAVRKGQPLQAIETFRPRLTPALDLKFDGTTVVSKNAQVDMINEQRHAELPGEPITWSAVKSGEAHKDWTNIPPFVRFKPGALVMCLMNRPVPKLSGYDHDDLQQDYFYVNGDQGHVIELVHAADPATGKLTQFGIKIRLHRTQAEVTVIPVTKEWVEPCKPPEVVPEDYVAKPGETVMDRQDAKDPAKHDRIITKRLKGTVTYMPLRLAYATTVHKSQGLSLDNVQVVISDWMFTKPGTMYVALSRAKTLPGLRIVGSERMFMSRCATDKKIARFL